MGTRVFMNIKFHERDSCPLMNIKFYRIVLLFIITLPADIGNAQVFCDHSANFTQGSPYATSQFRVFSSLVGDAPQTRFNTSVSGQSPDRVYGLLQCRGDTTVEQCQSCSVNATATIQASQSCGNAVGGRIWLDLCYLHYDNYNFFGQLDINYGMSIFNVNNVSSPDVFNATLGDLLGNLSTEAVSTSKLYASGTTAESSPKIYALVQCTGDISAENCTSCLSQTTTYIFKYSYGSPGVEGLFGSCIVHYEIYSFFNSPALPPPPSEAPDNTPPSPPSGAPDNTPVVTPSSKSTHSNKKPTILGVVVGGLLLVLLVCLFTTRRRLKSAIFRRGDEVHQQVEEDTLIMEDWQIVTFKMETLVTATENFHDDNKLGQGGFGTVYKGTTQDGKKIAVKKLSLNSVQGKNEFLNEVKLLAKIQHRNLVKLLGCCADGSEKLLVYEYLPNNSLDKILFDPIKRKQLDWQMRYNIILGIARGLLYLHQDSQPRIIHRDIKASNILLDDKLNPKIADFGLAKLFPEDESYVSTRVAGTFGYMAPEYALQGQLTVKADVYSFGVLLLEIVTGRKNTDYNLSSEMQILLGWAWRSYELGNIVQMIDPVTLIETRDEEQASRCIQVALLCTQADASLRPPMSTVTSMLSSDSAILSNPTKPVFVSNFNQNSRSTSSGFGLSHSYTTTSRSSLTPLRNDHVTITDSVPMLF